MAPRRRFRSTGLERALISASLLSHLAAATALLAIPVALQPSRAQGISTSAEPGDPDTRAYIGTWAITDTQNNLFNIRIEPGGRAVSTLGTAGVPSAGSRQLSNTELRELGRWRPWGNGVKIDYGNGWTDWIYMDATGLTHASWQPGQNRASVPTNYGPAVKLSGTTAKVVGVYLFPPAQTELKPYTASLLSNGLAFNDIDSKASGVWRLKGSTVVIDWISGWRTTMSLDPATPLQLRHWAPGADRKGPETGGIRQAQRLK